MAGAGRPNELSPAGSGYARRTVWGDGAVPGGYWIVCGNVLFGFAGNERAWFTNGTRRRLTRSVATRCFARPAADDGRNRHRRNRNPRAHALNGEPAL